MTPGGGGVPPAVLQAPRRITASASRWRRMGLVFGAVIVLWLVTTGGAIALSKALFGDSRDAGGLVAVGSALLYMVFLGFALSPRPLSVELWADRIVLDEGRRGVFPLATALLGVWQMPSYGVAMGTALHLSDGAHRFCLGGRDHRPHPALRLEAPVTESVDAYVTAAELDAIVALLPHVVWAGPQTMMAPMGTVAPEGVRCMLTPNRASTRNALSTMLPWLVTMALLAIVGALFGALDLVGSPVAMIAATTVSVLIIVGGIIATVLRATRRPTPALAVQLEAQGLRVLDVKTGAQVAAAHYVHVQAVPAKHTYTGKTTYTMPVLVLLVPGTKAITIGIPDFRFSWLGEARDHGTADYVVGGADWLALVERTGVRHRLNVGPG